MTAVDVVVALVAGAALFFALRAERRAAMLADVTGQQLRDLARKLQRDTRRVARDGA